MKADDASSENKGLISLPDGPMKYAIIISMCCCCLLILRMIVMGLYKPAKSNLDRTDISWLTKGRRSF